ncbi:unnamed protein product [Callosobruchus maculatus]|uniref:Uncharacterized protein n=1 Tax=Callosobruchus maculatus TaxID=64391 RepID=A0A653BRC9_CALMS|nr:unnamed protein product [Callosobruchus maculatus]
MHLTTRIAELQRKIDNAEAANRNSALLKQGFVVLSCDRVDQIQRAKYAKQRKLTRPKTSALSSRQGRKSSFRSNKVKLAIINKLRSTPRIRKKSSLSFPSDDAISIESMELKVKCVGSVSSSTLVKNMDSSASVATDDRIPESHRKRSSSIKHVGLRSSPTLIAPGNTTRNHQPFTLEQQAV